MPTMMTMNGSVVTPDEITSLIQARKLTREDCETASWAVETPQAMLSLSFEYSDGSVAEFDIDLYELDEDYDWSTVGEWDLTVKYGFLRVGHSEWELDLDLDEEEDTKRPDTLNLDSWTDSESIDFDDLWEHGDWEDVPNALEDAEDEDRQDAENEDRQDAENEEAQL